MTLDHLTPWTTYNYTSHVLEYRVPHVKFALMKWVFIPCSMAFTLFLYNRFILFSDPQKLSREKNVFSSKKLVCVEYVNKNISYSPCRWMLVCISFFPKGISNNWGRHRNMKFCLYNNLCVIVRACIYFRLLWFTRNVFKKDCWKHNQIYLDVKFTSWLCTSSTQTLFLNKLIF